MSTVQIGDKVRILDALADSAPAETHFSVGDKVRIKRGRDESLADVWVGTVGEIAAVLEVDDDNDKTYRFLLEGGPRYDDGDVDLYDDEVEAHHSAPFSVGDRVRVRRTDDEGFGTIDDIRGIDYIVRLDSRTGSGLLAWCLARDLTLASDTPVEEDITAEATPYPAGAFTITVDGEDVRVTTVPEDTYECACGRTHDLWPESVAWDDTVGETDYEPDDSEGDVKSASYVDYLDREVRSAALNLAVQVAPSGARARDVVRKAVAFERYLRSGE